MVTLKDIAAEAGVSITTVSNVVHNRTSRVSPERVAKIWEIIEREQYVPSMTARTLANAESSIIGVITHMTPQNMGSTMGDPFLSSFVEGIESRTRAEGYYLMIRSVEDARALERYLRLTGLSQAACAARLGRSQAAVANRLRLLKLSEDVLERLARGELTERHARALLRLPGGAEQSRTAELFVWRRMSVADAERHVDRLLSPEGNADALSRERQASLNRIWAELERMRQAVPEVSMTLRDEGGSVILEIRLPKG